MEDIKSARARSNKNPLINWLKDQQVPILYALVGLLAILVVSLSLAVKDVFVSRDQADATTMRLLLKSAVENIYNPAAVDAKDSRQYIYNARLSLPLSDDSEVFRYSFSRGVGDGSADSTEVYLSSQSALSAGYAAIAEANNFDGIFATVPTYQQCTKLFQLRFTNVNQDGFTSIGSKQLADGRTVYMYKNTSCNDFFQRNNMNMADLEGVVTQVESY
jgi:hypothetical protein